ncbi:MAG: hydantoinase/oxoprolinase family protein, partial [Chromatiales bacterium]|nr:hydantoinase/oxoprolinase family protein [Chromatiales bacterium]
TRLAEKGYIRHLYIMQSSGGMMTAAQIRRQPVNIIESGPAAGVVACHAIGQLLGRDNLLSFDMGGTTAKAALIHEGRIEMSTEYEVGSTAHGAQGGGGYGAGYPIRVPFMDIVEVGAGGGSIAWLDGADGLRVGPQSAGAEPGPVCYGRGGLEPTTTDANLYLGRLSADYFLGGEMTLDLAPVEVALKRLAAPLGLDALALASGITEVSNSHMVRALRRVSVERGRHPSQYSMVAFGGAGPLHACYLAEELGVPEVLIPPLPGVASAVGLLGADMRHEARRAFFGELGAVEPAQFNQAFSELYEQARAGLAGAGLAEDQLVAVGAGDMRYVGQAYELTVEWPTLTVDASTRAEMAARFHAQHRRLYAYDIPDRAIELVSLRVTVTATVARPAETTLTPSTGVPSPKGHRSVYFRDTGSVECPVYERGDLRGDDALAGPAVIEQKDSTTLLPPGWSLTVAPLGHLILSRETGESHAEC